MMNVYICSPLSGDIEGNIRKVKGYCSFAVSQDCMPWAPHIYFTQFLNDDVPEERQAGVSEGIKWLEHCEEMWVFGDRISEGMRVELDYANFLEIPIRCFSEDCVEKPVTPYLIEDCVRS